MDTPTLTPIARRVIGLSAAAALLVAGAVAAAPGHGPGAGEHHGGKHHGGMARMLGQADLDGDGQISRAEHDAHVAARLAAMDANGDGRVSFEEIQAFRAAQREQRARERFDRRADADGMISVESMAAAAERRFARMDRNGDGVISADEMHRGERHGRKGPPRGE
jgi:hypothetical protein